MKGRTDLGDAHPPADVLRGDQDGAGLRHVLVSTDMVVMIVRVDHEPYRLVRNLPDRGGDPVRQGRVLVIDEERAVLSDADRHVPAGPGEHEASGPGLPGLDLDLAEVTLGMGRNGQEKEG